MRLWRHAGPREADERMSVGDVVDQLDDLVRRLATETDRLEAANDRAESVMHERSDR